MPSSNRKNGTDRLGPVPWWTPAGDSQGPALIFNVQGQVGHLKNVFTAFEHPLLYIQSVLLSLNILKIQYMTPSRRFNSESMTSFGLEN